MKKFCAFLLALALLIPMGLVSVAGAEDTVATEPFYALGWSDFDQEKYTYMDGLVGSTFSNIGDKARISFGGVTLMYGKYTDEQVTKFAEAMKKTMEARPEGLRYWNIGFPFKIMKLAPKHVIYLDHGIDQMKDLVSVIFKKMKEINCPLDGVVIDTEYTGMGSWYLYADTEQNTNNYQRNKKIYAQIVADPRYATEVRPLLEERGFPFWTDIDETRSEIFSICRVNEGPEYDLARSIWDTVMRVRLNNYANEWCYEPLKQYYPEVSLSDYQSHDSKAWLKLSAITDDGVALNGGNSVRVGTASSFSYYYARPGASFFQEMKQYASFNDAVYEASAYNSLLYDINFSRHMYLSSDTRQIAPWITSYVYDGEEQHSMAYTPYYSELIYHLGMLDPEPFLAYTYEPEYSKEDWVLTQQILNELLAELTRVAGFADRKPIEMDQYWNTEFILSGMYAGGRNIWRVTPNTDEVSLEAFKVEGTDPTFSVKGRTVTFPGGKIIQDTAISTAGSCGYWVETAKDVMPVITHDPDRYANNPSLMVDFDECRDGRFFSTSVIPMSTWSSSGNANVVANGDGKAVSLADDSLIKSVRLPAKITAGDSYAKEQAWEITVSIPEGLSADAVVNLLTYAGAKQEASDGGFKISGGKVYYSTLGKAEEDGKATTEYKELMDISAGTYTFKRVVNFKDAEKYMSSYYVYDAAGKELGNAKDVVTPVFQTINAIGFSTEKADKAVVLDDYKLYPVGITTDFEIYDAATGMTITEEKKEEIRDRSTAYRLSWLNGSKEEKCYTVVAAIYQNGALVEEKAVREVIMKPGYDYVDTGVVEVAQGQSVKVYLKEGRLTAPDAPQDGTEKKPASNNLALIILIAAVVVAVVAVVVALIVTKPKKKPTDPKSETPEAEA